MRWYWISERLIRTVKCFFWPPEALMHNDRNVSKTTKLDGSIILTTFMITEICSYIRMRLGRMVLRSHRSSVWVSMEIMYRSMFQRFPLGN